MRNDKTLIWEGITILGLPSEWYLNVHFKQRVSMTYPYLFRSTRYPQQVDVSPSHGNRAIVPNVSIFNRLYNDTLANRVPNMHQVIFNNKICLRQKSKMKTSVLRSWNFLVSREL